MVECEMKKNNNKQIVSSPTYAVEEMLAVHVLQPFNHLRVPEEKGLR
jgi:hypothetical protein